MAFSHNENGHKSKLGTEELESTPHRTKGRVDSRPKTFTFSMVDDDHDDEALDKRVLQRQYSSRRDTFACENIDLQKIKGTRHSVTTDESRRSRHSCKATNLQKGKLAATSEDKFQCTSSTSSWSESTTSEKSSARRGRLVASGANNEMHFCSQGRYKSLSPYDSDASTTKITNIASDGKLISPGFKFPRRYDDFVPQPMISTSESERMSNYLAVSTVSGSNHPDLEDDGRVHGSGENYVANDSSYSASKKKQRGERPHPVPTLSPPSKGRTIIDDYSTMPTESVSDDSELMQIVSADDSEMKKMESITNSFQRHDSGKKKKKIAHMSVVPLSGIGVDVKHNYNNEEKRVLTPREAQGAFCSLSALRETLLFSKKTSSKDAFEVVKELIFSQVGANENYPPHHTQNRSFKQGRRRKSPRRRAERNSRRQSFNDESDSCSEHSSDTSIQYTARRNCLERTSMSNESSTASRRSSVEKSLGGKTRSAASGRMTTQSPGVRSNSAHIPRNNRYFLSDEKDSISCASAYIS